MARLSGKAVEIWAMRVTVAVMILLALQLAGCAGVGPKTVGRDRFDYVSAISESWKQQTLLNLLKTRYLDAPIFLDVGSVINQYAVEQEVDLGVSGEFYNRGDPSFIGPRVGARGRYTDRPTITYNPLMGEQFARSLLKPIPIPAVLLLLQAGYPADYVFRICVQTINGLKNRRSGTLVGREADTKFYELLASVGSLQAVGGLEVNFQSIDNKETVVMSFRSPEGETVTEDLKKALQLLALDPGVRDFRVVHGSFAKDDREIAILSRSMIQVMIEYASYIDVPGSDISEGRIYATPQEDVEKGTRFPPLLRVRNGMSKPENAFVAVPYRNRWFWIDDRDPHSKGTFYFLMMMFSFTERGGVGQTVPILTVPAN